MARYITEIEGHRLEIDVSAWSGMEVVSYDGREVSRRRAGAPAVRQGS